MASTIEQLFDKLPAADGSFRRRIISGSLVTIFAIYAHFPGLQESDILQGLTIKDIVTSPSVVFVLFALFYVIGGIIEIFGQLFVVRAVGEAIYFINTIQKRKFKNRLYYPFYWFIWFILGLFINYIYIFRGMIGITKYSLPMSRENLSKEAFVQFRGLPKKIKDGVVRPLGDNFDLSWEYLESELNDKYRKVVRNRINRTKEILAILTSIIFIAAILYPKILLYVSTSSDEMRKLDALHAASQEFERQYTDLSFLTVEIDELGNEIENRLSKSVANFLIPDLQIQIDDLIKKKLTVNSEEEKFEIDSIIKGYENEIEQVRSEQIKSISNMLADLESKLRLFDVEMSLETIEGFVLPNFKAISRSIETTLAINRGRAIENQREIVKTEEEFRANEYLAVILVYIILFLISLLFRGYFLSLKMAILQLLEFSALQRAPADGSTVAGTDE